MKTCRWFAKEFYRGGGFDFGQTPTRVTVWMTHFEIVDGCKMVYGIDR